MYIIYGIPNCNTVKKALQWLNEHQVSYQFHDYKKQGITEEKLKNWAAQTDWKNLINTKGTTWRQLDEAVQQEITTADAAIALMKEKTSVIKRPLIEQDEKIVTLGFDEATYRKLFTRNI